MSDIETHMLSHPGTQVQLLRSRYVLATAFSLEYHSVDSNPGETSKSIHAVSDLITSTIRHDRLIFQRTAPR